MAAFLLQLIQMLNTARMKLLHPWRLDHHWLSARMAAFAEGLMELHKRWGGRVGGNVKEKAFFVFETFLVFFRKNK